MVGVTRRSSTRVAVLAIGLVLISGMSSLSRSGPSESATAAETAPTSAAATATAPTPTCPRPKLTSTRATGGTTQFGWLLQPGPSTTQQRDWLQYNVTAGTVICDSVTLTNSSRRAVSVQLYAADAYNIAADGGFAFTAFHQRTRGVGTWITLPITKVTVASGRAVTIPIVVRVPATVTPGDTAGGVVARETRVRHGQKVSGVDVGVRAGVGVRLYANVAGVRRPELSLTDLELHLRGGLLSRFLGSSTAIVTYRVGNAGNVRLSPTSGGKVTTRTRTIGLPEHEFAELLPGSPRIAVEDSVHGLRWGSLIGRVRVEVTVTADGAEAVTMEKSVWRVPWLSLIALAAAIALIATVLVVRRRRHRVTGDVAKDAEDAEELDPVAS
ncbi:MULTISPECIES: hypothetical protein [unclassified Nocardioides]|uniref:hypothetical protein n=1 Tax=unclassified Nocardioides TaxID=2615069 RepID=UPI000A96BFA7|nr:MULTISPECIES: hypothetical protein [unclassified Nocardioides]